ncbi:hypothetical protein NC651_033210 [Populus alba x Populus x berolinensis]|nr:hypothetical protein NC651_033210 [Populus alba x Populus x berolinensis]
MARFSKVLRKTDIQKRLSVPTGFLSSLPSFNGGAHAVDFQAVDGSGRVWTFRSSIRRNGHPKPVISRGWLAYVHSKSLKVGDKTMILLAFQMLSRRVCDEITRQGRILMQRQYTSNLVDSEALEARWYCSILNFQLYLAVILLFHLFWEFFEGKTISGRENKHKVVERMMMVLQMASESVIFTQ